MFHVFDKEFICLIVKIYVLLCVVCFSTLFTLFFYNMNLYFGPAALQYIINNILSYLFLSYLILQRR